MMKKKIFKYLIVKGIWMVKKIIVWYNNDNINILISKFFKIKLFW